MQLATTGLFRAKWTNEIHEEWIRNLLAKRNDITREKLDRVRSLMDASVLDCLVEGYESLTTTVCLPDPDDRHVVAAAIACGANAIVTYNLKDFPEEALRAFNIEAIHPDEFINFQMDLSMADVLVSVQRCRGRLKAPPISSEEFLDILEGQSLPKTVAALRPYAAIL